MTPMVGSIDVVVVAVETCRMPRKCEEAKCAHSHQIDASSVHQWFEAADKDDRTFAQSLSYDEIILATCE